MPGEVKGSPLGLACPGCGEPPVFLYGGGTQAFCGADDGCPVLTWDPTETAEEFWASLKLDLRGGESRRPATRRTGR